MATPAKSFIDLPSELRNQVYEHYLADVDETTITICRGEILPPALARTSRQVRKESMSYWASKQHDFAETRNLKAVIIDLDCGLLISFVEHALKITDRRELFEPTSVHLVFTGSWMTARNKARLDEWID